MYSMLVGLPASCSSPGPASYLTVRMLRLHHGLPCLTLPTESNAKPNKSAFIEEYTKWWGGVESGASRDRLNLKDHIYQRMTKP